MQETPISSNGGKRLQFSQSYEELKGSPLAPSLSQSPLSQKSAKYAERSNSGTVVSSYGTSNLHYTGEISSKCEVKQLPCSNNSNFVSAYKFMFERLRDCVAVLDDSIYEFGSNILQKHNQEIEEFTSFSHLGNEPIWCLGQICCDSVGKLNSASVVLQGDTDFGQGELIKLDLSRLQSYSLFPGQIVAVKGINATGHCFTVHEIISGDILPLYPMSGSSNSGAVQVLIASGPFTTRDNLLYEPLMDLINVALKNPPNVLLLLGPLLDISHPCVEHSTFEDSFDTVIARLLDKIYSAFSGTSTQVFIVASHQDACCVPVYPTPPVLSADPNNCGVRILPDPCLIDIDGTSLGLTTLDVPLHLSREEINFKPKNMDRLSRLSEHLLRQQTFYPLHPGPQGLPVDVRRKDIHCRLPFTPHVMVTPSDLKGFLKEVHGCLFVNPDRMTKGSSGGCFCRLTILPGSSQHPVISAQIVKI